MSPGDHCDHVASQEEIDVVVNPFLEDIVTGIATGIATDTVNVDSLFKQWSLTPDGYRVRDSRIPSDPIRLGSILDDNARMAFIAGFKAANR